MHTLIFTEKLLQELRQILQNDEILISVRSHKHSQYWWYPEQESRTQVLVINAYTSNAILEKTKELSESFQYISKLKTNFSENETKSIRQRGDQVYEFDDPEEDVENVINDNVIDSKEVRMYRTELYGHSVLGVTFTKADIDYRVLLHMTSVPLLTDIDTVNATCLVKSKIGEPTALLLRNRCKKAMPVFIYIRADNPFEQWDRFQKTGAFYTFFTEIRSCRIWKYARPEPSWQTTSCIPEMNRSIHFGVHCRCNFISDLDADAKPIIAVRMNLKCHLERPVVGFNYQIVICYVVIPSAVIVFLFIQMHRTPLWDKRLYLEEIKNGKLCLSGDIIARITFGGRCNSGSSANILISMKSSRGQLQIIVYQDPVYRAFERNSTILFRLQRELVQLPVRLSLGHDNSGIYPHFFCRSVVLTDLITKQTQHFHVQRWVRASHMGKKYELTSTFNTNSITTPKVIYKWSTRFSMSFEICMGQWYLFQPLTGPWRLGINRQSHSRWERSCIYMGKIFSSVCIAILMMGGAVPIVCDPSPKRYTDFDILTWLCVISLIVSCIMEVIMNLFLKMLSKYN